MEQLPEVSSGRQVRIIYKGKCIGTFGIVHLEVCKISLKKTYFRNETTWISCCKILLFSCCYNILEGEQVEKHALIIMTYILECVQEVLFFLSNVSFVFFEQNGWEIVPT